MENCFYLLIPICVFAWVPHANEKWFLYPWQMKTFISVCVSCCYHAFNHHEINTQILFPLLDCHGFLIPYCCHGYTSTNCYPKFSPSSWLSRTFISALLPWMYHHIFLYTGFFFFFTRLDHPRISSRTFAWVAANTPMTCLKKCILSGF